MIRSRCLAMGAAVIWLGSAPVRAALPEADFLVHGGTVYSGADAPGIEADVVIAGDTIIYVGPAGAQHYHAHTRIDATHKIVAPGFIDAHTHPESYVRSTRLRQRLNAPWVYQGVTTLMIGVDGAGTFEVAKESRAYERQTIGTNLVPYVGFGAVRHAVLRDDARTPTAAELDRMRTLVAKGMCEGAIGFSTGLFYAPQSFASTEEVIALAREAATRGGLYDTHQRDESSYGIGLLASVQEVIRIGTEAGLPVHFAHIKALGVDVQGSAPQVISAIEAARARGLEVAADQYPYLASGTSLGAALLPRWAVDGGRTAMLGRLADATTLPKIKREMIENLRRRGGAGSLLLTSAHQAWTGDNLQQLADKWQADPVEAALRVIRAAPDADDVASFNMVEPDVRLFMRQPWVVTASDGSDGHPREYATFPTKYARYVVAEHVISLEQFIRSSTGLTADMFRLQRRGYLRPNYFADVVVIDPQRYAPKADYEHPRVLSAGVEQLFVNGRPVLRDGQPTGQAPGRVLLHEPPAGSCPVVRARSSRS